jgi:excisionase family DNA binding protein
MNDTPPPVYLTADEAAELLRTTRKAVYDMASRGKLPGLRRFGRRLLINRKELLAAVEKSKR